MEVIIKFVLAALLVTTSAIAQSDPWPPSALVSAAPIAEKVKNGNAPLVIYVGFPILYKGAHIVGATFAGPCSKQEGLDLLATAVKDLPHDTQIVLYCGCCPFVKCPNVRPAFRALKDAGYTNIKVLQLDTNLHTDWVEKGYPVAAK